MVRALRPDYADYFPARADRRVAILTRSGRTGPHGHGLPLEMSLVLAAHDDDRARRVVHAVLPDRAQQRLGQPAVPAAAHHEQVRSFRRSDQHRPGTPFRYIWVDLDLGVDRAH